MDLRPASACPPLPHSHTGGGGGSATRFRSPAAPDRASKVRAPSSMSAPFNTSMPDRHAHGSHDPARGVGRRRGVRTPGVTGVCRRCAGRRWPWIQTGVDCRSGEPATTISSSAAHHFGRRPRGGAIWHPALAFRGQPYGAPCPGGTVGRPDAERAMCGEAKARVRDHMQWKEGREGKENGVHLAETPGGVALSLNLCDVTGHVDIWSR